MPRKSALILPSDSMNCHKLCQWATIFFAHHIHLFTTSFVLML